jgi:hypothetical protein
MARPIVKYYLEEDRDRAGEGQQQITALLRVVTESPVSLLVEEKASFLNT